MNPRRKKATKNMRLLKGGMRGVRVPLAFNFPFEIVEFLVFRFFFFLVFDFFWVSFCFLCPFAAKCAGLCEAIGLWGCKVLIWLITLGLVMCKHYCLVLFRLLPFLISFKLISFLFSPYSPLPFTCLFCPSRFNRLANCTSINAIFTLHSILPTPQNIPTRT